MIIYENKIPPPAAPTFLFDMGRRPSSINHSVVLSDMSALVDWV